MSQENHESYRLARNLGKVKLLGVFVVHEDVVVCGAMSHGLRVEAKKKENPLITAMERVLKSQRKSLEGMFPDHAGWITLKRPSSHPSNSSS